MDWKDVCWYIRLFADACVRAGGLEDAWDGGHAVHAVFLLH